MPKHPPPVKPPFRPSKHPILKWVFPALVLILTGCMYLVFVYVNLFPQLERLQYFAGPATQESIEKTDPHVHKASVAEVVGITVAFHVLFFLFLVSFFRCILTPPGTIPDNPKWRLGQFLNINKSDKVKLNELMSIENNALDMQNPYLLFFLRMFPLVERKKKKFGVYRQCEKEGKCTHMWKPDRCHHCGICDSCILRMDHHCPWIANCVGFHNYKFFFLLLLYATCCLAFVMGALFPRLMNVFQPILDVNYFLRRDLLVLMAYVVSLFFFITLAMFFAFHLWLVLHAMTTIEYKEKALVKHLFRVTRVKYDYGYYSNLVHALGPPYMWFLPISPPPLHFTSLQRQYLMSLTNSKEFQSVEGFKEQTRNLAEQLGSFRAIQESRYDVGCYYTHYSTDIQLWHPSYEGEGTKKPKKKVRLRTSQPDGETNPEGVMNDTDIADVDTADEDEDEDQDDDDPENGDEEEPGETLDNQGEGM